MKHTGSCGSKTPARAEPVHGSVHELAAPGASAERCAIEPDTVVAGCLLLPGEFGDSYPSGRGFESHPPHPMIASAYPAELVIPRRNRPPADTLHGGTGRSSTLSRVGAVRVRRAASVVWRLRRRSRPSSRVAGACQRNRRHSAQPAPSTASSGMGRQQPQPPTETSEPRRVRVE